MVEAEAATRAAALQLKHTFPSEAELASGRALVKDQHPDTSEEYRILGKEAHADWTVRGVVDVREARYRLELETCQIKSGRVEYLAREITPASAETEVREMLALLLRPEGIGTGEVPWSDGPARGSLAKPQPPPQPPPGPPPPVHRYAEKYPFALGLSLGFASAAARPSGASGSAESLFLGASAAYAPDAAPGFELRGNMAMAALGPRALTADAGARYAVPLLARYRFFVAPEAGLGTFVTLGADKTARFFARAALALVLGLGDRIQFEAAADLGASPGGSGAILLVGGTLRGLYRF